MSEGRTGLHPQTQQRESEAQRVPGARCRTQGLASGREYLQRSAARLAMIFATQAL
jgi:hypothetical protein